MKYSQSLNKSSSLIQHLSKYASEGSTLPEIAQNLSKEIKGQLDNQDFKVMLVKESIPILILALLDYSCYHFMDSDERTQLESSLFYLLSLLCKDNNFCKAQVFKGDALRHLRCLIRSQNKQCFFFLYKICNSEDNIAAFLGKGVFSEIVRSFKKYQKEVLMDYKVASKDIEEGSTNLERTISTDISVDDWSFYIILNNLFAKLMDKNFSNETLKLQSSLEIQEALFPSLSQILLPQLIKQIKNKGVIDSESTELKKELFLPENDSALLKVLNRKKVANSINYSDLNIISLQLIYSSLKAFNMACSNVFSSQVRTAIYPHLEQIKQFLFEDNISQIQATDPYGLDTELIILLKNFELIPESNLMIEREFNMSSEENQPFEEDEPANDDIVKLFFRA